MPKFSDLVMSFVLSVPVWAILSFFLYRAVRENDVFKKCTFKNFELIKETLSNLDKNLALVQKDIEYASNLSKVVSNLTENMGSVKKDVDNCFARLREVEAGAE